MEAPRGRDSVCLASFRPARGLTDVLVHWVPEAIKGQGWATWSRLDAVTAPIPVQACTPMLSAGHLVKRPPPPQAAFQLLLLSGGQVTTPPLGGFPKPHALLPRQGPGRQLLPAFTRREKQDSGASSSPLSQVHMASSASWRPAPSTPPGLSFRWF